MKTTHAIFCIISLMLATLSINAQQIYLQSDPEDAEVYINGQMVASTTPAIIKADKKWINKTIIFQFKKAGYENKSVTLTFNKKELKANPTVRCTMKRSAESLDPTIRKGEARKAVSRDNAGQTALERTIIRWAFESDPAGARIFWRVISSVPDEVKNTNETYLTTTPYEETRGFNILGMTYENSRDVTIEVKVRKKGYNDQVKRFNARQAIDQQEISGFFELVKKDDEE